MAIRSLRAVAAGHAFVQNLRRGHYEITVDVPVQVRAEVAFTEFAPCL
jgi:adenosine/AMP kinase